MSPNRPALDPELSPLAPLLTDLAAALRDLPPDLRALAEERLLRHIGSWVAQVRAAAPAVPRVSPAPMTPMDAPPVVAPAPVRLADAETVLPPPVAPAAAATEVAAFSFQLTPEPPVTCTPTPSVPPLGPVRFPQTHGAPARLQRGEAAPQGAVHTPTPLPSRVLAFPTRSDQAPERRKLCFPRPVALAPSTPQRPTIEEAGHEQTVVAEAPTDRRAPRPSAARSEPLAPEAPAEAAPPPPSVGAAPRDEACDRTPPATEPERDSDPGPEPAPPPRLRIPRPTVGSATQAKLRLRASWRRARRLAPAGAAVLAAVGAFALVRALSQGWSDSAPLDASNPPERSSSTPPAALAAASAAPSSAAMELLAGLRRARGESLGEGLTGGAASGAPEAPAAPKEEGPVVRELPLPEVGTVPDGYGLIEVVVEPTLRVYVDGTFMGLGGAPRRVPVKPGPHVVRLLDGGRETLVPVEVAVGQRTQLVSPALTVARAE